MNCSKVRKHLDDYVLGELDPAVEIQINAHVLTCDHCRKRIEEEEAACVALSGAARFEPAEALFSRTKSRVRKLPGAKKVLFAGWQLGLAYAVAFLIGMVVMKAIDARAMKVRGEPKVEVQYEPQFKKPFSDTVFFSPAPPKNLARS